MRFSRVVPFVVGMAAMLAPAAAAQNASPVASPMVASSFGTLRFLGEQRVPNDLMVGETLVGGLSGIDYTPATGEWVIISDDRGANGPVRFYTAQLGLDEGGFASVEITGETALLSADGEPYETGEEGTLVPDPEAIRFDPVNAGEIWWSGEGDSAMGMDPQLVHVDASGTRIGSIDVPAMFAADPFEERGARTNNGFEGLSFSADGETLWVAMETALIQDGPIATVEHGATSRLTQFDRDGTMLAQYVYELDPIQAVPTGEGADNGVSELLAIDATRFLVLERSGVSTAAGPWDLYIRIYLIDISGATDVSGLESLDGADYIPVSKELVLNLAETDLAYVDNIEGMSWGPVLENGNATLVLVSDNNFNPETQVTQFLAYEVVSR
jgi:hypothetical protein